MSSRKPLLAGLAALLLSLGLAAQGMQGTQKMNMNDMPYSKVKAMMSSPAMKKKAMAMAKKEHVILMVGQPVNEGKQVTMKGELTGANCYLSVGLHGHHHALCAKACVLAGTPVVFLSGGKVYTVLTAKDGMPLPKAALDDLGTPGVTVHGVLLDSHGVNSLAVQSVQR